MSASRNAAGSATGLPTVILCADDFGIAPGVDTAILELLSAGRLSATSCMTVTPGWPDRAGWLRQAAPEADIGLHLVLTDLSPLGPMPRLAPRGRLPTVGRLIGLCHAGLVDREEIEAEIVRQLAAFVSFFGRDPDFIDGHQHIQLLPVIRDALIKTMKGRFPHCPPYTRVCWDMPREILTRGVAPAKTLFIGLLSAGLRRKLIAERLPANDRFRGIHDFSGRVAVRALFRRFLAAPVGRTLIMCHPGRVDAVLERTDRLLQPREWELAYLAGPDFPDDLSRLGVRLGRFAPAGR